MPKFLTIPAADGDDLSNARIHNTDILTGLTNGLSYICYRLSAPSSSFIPVGGSQLTLTEFSRDRTLFDGGAVLGRAAADVPLRGTAPAGTVVQARVLRDDDSIALGWTNVATADEGGAWSGKISVPVDRQWMRSQVRLASATDVLAAAGNRFGVGHVWTIWGQSEPRRILDAFATLATTEKLASDDMVQIIWAADGLTAAPQVHHLSAAAPLTTPAMALANTLMATRPNEKFAIVFQCQPSAGFQDLFNDSDNDIWVWSNAKAVHDFATADGQQIGLAAMSWYNTHRSLSANFGAVFFGLVTGRKLADGTALTIPGTIPYTASTGSFQADHTLAELYDYGYTRVLPYGPHRFEISQDMQSATLNAAGVADGALTTIQNCRTSLRAAIASAHNKGTILPQGLEPLSYQQGYTNAAGTLTDLSHPGLQSADGTMLWARYTALALLQGAGMTDWQVPAFDRCAWAATGTHVEVWSSEGAVTTLRKARGEAALGTAQAHWTEVFGFQINGVPAKRAEIVDGRVRIYPLAAAFVAGDVLTFGEGGATGYLAHPEDFDANGYKNLPIVDVGAAGVAGVSVRPLPDAAVLANTIGTATWAFNVTGTGATVQGAPADMAAPAVTDITTTTTKVEA